MKKLILSATFLAVAGLATVKANNVSNRSIDSVSSHSIDSASNLLIDSVSNRSTDSASNLLIDSVSNRSIDSVVTIQQDSTTKTPVKIEELPDPVKTTLSADKYKEWAPTASFLVTAADKTEWYQIDVKKGEEVASLKVGKDGVVVQ